MGIVPINFPLRKYQATLLLILFSLSTVQSIQTHLELAYFAEASTKTMSGPGKASIAAMQTHSTSSALSATNEARWYAPLIL